MNCAIALLVLLLLAASGAELFAAQTMTTTTATTVAAPEPRVVTWQKLADETELAEMEMRGAPKPVQAAKILFRPGGGSSLGSSRGAWGSPTWSGIR